MPRADWDYIATFPFALPSLAEQQRMVAILSTWDTAISKAQQLIKQKEQRKKALMQQLLTGKKRLRGFNGKWNIVKAAESFENVSRKKNGIEVLLSVTQDRGAIPRDMLEARVTMPDGDTSSFKLVEVGDFIISLRSFQGGIEYSDYRGLVSPAYTVLKPVKKISRNFYRYYFKSHDFIGHLAVAVIGIRDGKQVSFDEFSILKIPCPSLEEQEAIAGILMKAENELALLRQKLDALGEQKKGLMQKLLTGQVRMDFKS